MNTQISLPSSPAAAARIESLLIKPVSALCNLNCAYCFYLDRETDPYAGLGGRIMSQDTLERLVDGWMFYSYPVSNFAFQGGEPTLAGLPFYKKLVQLQQRLGRTGQSVSNSIQTNGLLIDEQWAEFLAEYKWLVGLSLDGPEQVHDHYRRNRAGSGSWRQAMRSLKILQEHKVEHNILCVVSRANVGQAGELYRFFRSCGASNLQFIPLAEFDSEGNPLEFTPAPADYGRFLLELFEIWWPERRRVRIRFFDNLAEALAGSRPGSCALLAACDSYVVVEYNGDVYPCDFFVDEQWRLGNIHIDSWAEIARREKRRSFASKKALPHPACARCEYSSICLGGCPKFRYQPRRDFSELDYFCGAYKMIFARACGPLAEDVRKLIGRRPERAGGQGQTSFPGGSGGLTGGNPPSEL